MNSAPVEAPRQFLSALENKFSQLNVTLSPDDASLALSGANAEPLPVYTPSETPMPASSTIPKAQPSEAHGRGRSPGPRSLAARGLLRHRTTSRNKSKSGQQPQTAALVVQLKRRLRQHQRQQAGGDSDEMEMDVDERRGRASRRSSVRTGVLAARKRRESGDVAEDGDGDVSGIDVGTSRTGATPYERNNSALVCWSRRRACSFGERPRWMGLTETGSPVPTPSDQSTLPLPASSPARRKRSGRSASTSGLPNLDTTDLTVRRPSFAMSLIMTPLIQDVDMASPMAMTPVLRTSTESSMWAPRKLQLGVTHGPIDDEEPSTPTPRVSAATPVSPPPAYDSVIRPIIEDSDGDADDEQTPLRTAPSAPLITVRDASPPAPGSGSGASKGSSSLATVTEEEEEVDGDGETEPAKEGGHIVAPDEDQDAMVL